MNSMATGSTPVAVNTKVSLDKEVDATQQESFPVGAVVLEEGGRARRIYVLREGRVQVVRGDVVLAEPKSLICFAGPNVIRQTIRSEIPEDFQTSEFLLEHGFIDRIVPRDRMAAELARLISLLSPKTASHA